MNDMCNERCIKVIKLTNNPDGSADMEYEASKEFRTFVKERLGVKRLTSKRLNDFVLEMLTKAANCEDGYEFINECKKK